MCQLCSLQYLPLLQTHALLIFWGVLFSHMSSQALWYVITALILYFFHSFAKRFACHLYSLTSGNKLTLAVPVYLCCCQTLENMAACVYFVDAATSR